MPFPKFVLSMDNLKAGRFAPLLSTLVLVLFVLHPLLRPFPLMALTIDITFIVVLVAACYAVADSHRALIVSVLTVLFAVACGVLGTLYDSTALHIISDLLTVFFFGYIALTILDRVLNTKSFTLDSIFGAVCVYILIGVMWAFIYSLIEEVSPGSFSVSSALEGSAGGAVRPGELFIYYSFVTLTTLGYGDISPVSGIARMMASLEAIVGPMFVAILVAWLVSEAASTMSSSEQ
ncbi:MAG: hypothetical protein JSW67_12515 [Candidatus Latescibacterota bacterium]|nr:MAG: hypothetical protein JSW67_12515 [Candidatus Latescibacterota bacterium]